MAPDPGQRPAHLGQVKEAVTGQHPEAQVVALRAPFGMDPHPGPVRFGAALP